METGKLEGMHEPPNLSPETLIRMISLAEGEATSHISLQHDSFGIYSESLFVGNP